MKPAYLIALAAVTTAAAAQPLTLDEALRAGVEQSPRLAAQRHMVSAAGELVSRSGELPDPRLRLGIENVPVTGDDSFRYGRDSMTMGVVGVTQEFPNGAKREARQQRAERAREVESAGLSARQAILRRDVALAWLELYYSQRMQDALGRLAQQFQRHLEALPAGIASGRRGAADAFTLRQELEQTNDRITEQERLAARARIALASWIGEQAGRPLGDPPDTARFAHPREHIVARLAEHPELRTFERREGLAQAEVDLARSARKSDWMLEVGYGQRRPYFDNMLTVMVAFDLPWQKDRRQDRDVAAKLAELEQVRAIREDARRMHDAEVRGWLADFDAAARRIGRFEQTLLPLAEDRRSASLAAYRGGRGELGALLEAERAVTDAELSHVAALAERGKAWANLSFLYP